MTEITSNQKQLQFENLLERTKSTVLQELSSIEDPSALTGNQFEKLVFSHMQKNAVGTEFENILRHTPDREFPDIVDDEFFGIEVKATKKDDWTSIGNSVLESSRDVRTRKIYVFFGKLGGNPDIMWKDYEDCLRGIAVTHYPRYQIDMKLSEGNSIFDKMGVSYDQIKASDNPVQPIRRYYKSLMKEGQALWWMDDNTENVTVSAPIVSNYSSLSQAEKNSIMTDIYIRFPVVLSKGNKKYAEVATYLISEKSVVSSSLRDSFSAGRHTTVTYDDQVVEVPQSVVRLLSYSHRIVDQLQSMSLATLSDLWRVDLSSFEKPIDAWLSAIDEQSSHMELEVPLSDLFRARINGRLSLPE